MRRFFTFVLLVFLLLVAVDSLRKWRNERPDAVRFPTSLADLLGHRDTVYSHPEKYTLADGPRLNPADVDVLAAMSQQRVVLCKAVVPSVVSIITSKTIREPAYVNDPLFQFFHRGRRFPNGSTQYLLGSGVIVSKEGHIVTNNHVIEQMDDIQVELSDGRHIKASLVGTDPDTDVAVLKVDAANDITPLAFGDSDKVEVGETIMAVGNPYGFEETVTQGIICAKGRTGSDVLRDLFQIDAAINPGNSGGPLVNVRGELIGLNDQIFTQSGGWQGVGFAIPSATVRRTLDRILKNGRVIYGYLGVLQSPQADAFARLGEPAKEKGVLVSDVVPGSPAEKAAIKPGDLIEKFNNQEVHDIQDLRRCVSQVNIDASVPIELLRNGQSLTVTAQVGEKPAPEVQLAALFHRQQRSQTSAGGPASLPGNE